MTRNQLPAPARKAGVSAISGGIVFRSAVAANVMVIIHLVTVLLGVLASAQLVGLIHSLGLGQLVDLGANKAGKNLLGEGVADRLACSELVRECASN